jgi:hypothetical protein
MASDPRIPNTYSPQCAASVFGLNLMRAPFFLGGINAVLTGPNLAVRAIFCRPFDQKPAGESLRTSAGWRRRFGKTHVRVSHAILVPFTIKSGEGKQTIICFCESAMAISGKIPLSSLSYVKLHGKTQDIIIVRRICLNNAVMWLTCKVNYPL